MSVESIWDSIAGKPRVVEIGLSQLDFRCKVSSDDARAVAWTAWFLRPWFRREDVCSPDWSLAFLHDDSLFRQLSDEQQRARLRETNLCVQHNYSKGPCSAFDLGECRVLYDVEFLSFCLFRPELRSAVIVAESDNTRAPSTLMRIVRELAMLDHQRKNGLVLHAAAVENEGRATLIVAPKRGGKTTFLLGALNNGARMLANDRLVLTESAGEIEALGIPTVVSLREGSLDLFPEVREALYSQWMHFRRFAQRTRRSNKRTLSPTQLCRILHAPPSDRAVVEKILFLKAGRGRAKELAPQKIKSRLKAELFDFTDTENHMLASLYPVGKERFSDSIDRISALIARQVTCLEYPREGESVPQATPARSTSGAPPPEG